MFNKAKNSNLFQGHLQKSNYFEGWYYKQVTADQKTTLSFIPAVSLNADDMHSFIQYILVTTDETTGKEKTHTGYLRYPISDFTYLDQPFGVQIGKSIFTETFLSVDLQDDQYSFEGILGLGALQPIQTSLLQPNIMGVFGYIPKMECYHGVVSMQHSLSGELIINGETVDFTDGKGYIEKDWGTSFPKEYIWLHSNHFSEPTASLFFSIAHIPFYFTEFEGFICNFTIKGREYRFATYNYSQCTIENITETSVEVLLENKNARLLIQAEVLGQGKLIAPVQGIMEKTIKEGIGGVLSIRLEDKQTGEVFEDKGENAGVEIVDYC